MFADAATDMHHHIGARMAGRVDLQHAQPVVDRAFRVVLIEDFRETIFTFER